MTKKFFISFSKIIKSACIVSTSLLLAGCVDFAALFPFTSSSPVSSSDGSVTVSFFDVGQADSTLITLPDGKYVLIDSGNAADGELIAAHLNELGITTLDLLVATHPHEDHIGGMVDIFEQLEILQVYMPELSEKDIPATKTYERFLDEVIAEQCQVKAANAGDMVMEGDGYDIICLSPGTSDIGDLNNYSAVLKLNVDDVSFIFMGDAETPMEENMMDSCFDLSADIIKLGHHGSKTSTSEEFLMRVKPSLGIISCGEGNSYGHPDSSTLKLLSKHKIDYFRTDQVGTIHIVTDGQNFETSTDRYLILDGNRK